MEFTTLQVSTRETAGGKTQISLLVNRRWEVWRSHTHSKRGYIWLRQTIIIIIIICDGGERSFLFNSQRLRFAFYILRRRGIATVRMLINDVGRSSGGKKCMNARGGSMPLLSSTYIRATIPPITHPCSGIILAAHYGISSC